MISSPKHYVELHVTVLAGDDFEKFRGVIAEFCKYKEYNPIEWKVSRFSDDDVDGMEGNWFCSARIQHYAAAIPAMRELRDELLRNGYLALRAKAEDTIFDTQYGDELGQ